ncbi:MAG TPA: alpha/beta hydrolase-fold protein [Actinomycetota bacterium]|nr:alpha/beta hydrolase-fold protein [Actinomycetota bacterium]
MTLRPVDGSPGPPWDRGLPGRLERLVVESEVLAGNPLGDPTRRPLYVFVPDGIADGERVPAIYVIQGMTGQLDMFFNRPAFEPTTFEWMCGAFADASVPRALLVFVDAWTRFGGSQFVNSAGTGRYMDYLCDEVVPFVDSRYPTVAQPGARGLTGKSSGGYGAMVVPMMRPDVFGALATHSGDALFEVCYLPDFRESARVLRDRYDGSVERFVEDFETSERFTVSDELLNSYTMALCYSPDEARPGTAVLPFDTATGALRDDVWERWLAWDPVRMVPKHADALAGMRLVYVDAGTSDEYYLDLGAQAFSNALTEHGIEHTLELFEGKHGRITWRYPLAVKALAGALDR